MGDDESYLDEIGFLNFVNIFNFDVILEEFKVFETKGFCFPFFIVIYLGVFTRATSEK